MDIVISRVVLEHIPPAQLRCLHDDFARALRQGGIVSHVVDNSDHREHRDKRLSRIEFLRVSRNDLATFLRQSPGLLQ